MDIVSILQYISKPALKLKRLNIDPLSILGRLSPIFFPIFFWHTYDSFLNFCMFIGHGRSGSAH